MKTYINKLAFQTDSVFADEGILTVPQKILDGIEKAKEICKNSPFIDYIMVNASGVDVILLDEGGNLREDFKIDTTGITVSSYSTPCYRGYNKWDSGQYFEIYLD